MFQDVTSESKHKKILGIIWILLWSLSFTIAVSFAKSLSQNVNIPTIVFTRSAFGLIFVLPFILKNPVSNLKSSQPGMVLWRVILVTVSLACTYYAYRNLPIAVATTIGFTSPLMTTLLAIFFLKEKVGLKQWFLILLGYASVVLIASPQSAELNLALMIDLAGNFLASCAIIVTKKLSKTDKSLTILFYTSLFTTVVSAFFAVIYGVMPPLADIAKLALVGGFGVFSQFCYIEAIKYEKPSFLAPFDYTRIVIAIPIGLLFFKEMPTIHTIIGAVVIIVSTYVLSRIELKSQN